MIVLEETTNGLLLAVKAQPGARRNTIAGEHAGALKIAVTQAPEKGKANDAIIVVMAQLLDLKRHQIRLAAGPTSSQKKFLITGISLVDLQQRIEAAMGGR
ncbi:MAG: DUF167 domain-containing protein [Planctomycetes bacterium]|nr:DUF167 domain-containing protein [Planctomycetota bacterium]